MTVLEATIQTLKNLGGKAHYSKIYEEYENVIGYKITKNSKLEYESALKRTPLTLMYLTVKMTYSIQCMEKAMVYGDYDDCFVLCFVTDEIVPLSLQLNLKIA